VWQVTAMLKKIKATTLREIKKTAHSGKNKPYTSFTEGVPSMYVRPLHAPPHSVE
jgi:hypothetical protein